MIINQITNINLYKYIFNISDLFFVLTPDPPYIIKYYQNYGSGSKKEQIEDIINIIQWYTMRE